MTTNITRRNLIKVSLAGLAGLGVGLYLYQKNTYDLATVLGKTAGFLPNAFIHISYDSEITFFCKVPEIGQGIQTAFSILVAEELALQVADINVVQAPVSYQVYGRQVTGGSLSIKQNYLSLRYAAAAVYQLLKRASAELFEESNFDLIRLENKEARHLSSGKRIRYGNLARLAEKYSLPEQTDLVLKSRSDFDVIGKAHSGMHNQAMLRGELRYVSDLNEAGMLYANFIRAPKSGMQLLNYNELELLGMSGIVGVRYLSDNQRSDTTLNGIAIIGESSWQVLKARKALRVKWQASRETKEVSPIVETFSSGQGLKDALGKGLPKLIHHRVSNDQTSLENQMVTASYSYPFLAHNVMENQVCLMQYLPDEDIKLRIWQNSQKPYHGIKAAANYLGLSIDQVEAQQIQAGGGFGRRLYNDVLIQSAAIAALFPDRKLKLFYTKEDEFINDHFRAACLHRITCSGNKQAELGRWQQTLYSLSDNDSQPVTGGSAPTEGFPYDWASDLKVEQATTPINIRCGAWRSPGTNGHVFASQSALQELAESHGIDYQSYLVAMLRRPPITSKSNVDSERAIAVINKVCELGDWGRSEKSFGQGLAFCVSHSGYFAELVSLRIIDNQKIVIDDIFVVGDVGLIVNPAGAVAQVKSAILDALEASVFQAIEFGPEGVLTKSYAAHACLQNKNIPKISVNFIHSNAQPTGLGEPALPPLAPAFCHAIFNASGQRIRDLPIMGNSAFTFG